ncbi:MAG: EamA family transporter, partial [Candidatus Hodarchaeota archaeon]
MKRITASKVVKKGHVKYLILAVLAAILFGLSTPVSKLLLSNLSPILLAGLLYLGTTLILFPFALRDRE